MASGTDFHFTIPVSKPILELDDGRYNSINAPSGDSQSKKDYHSKKNNQLCSVHKTETVAQSGTSFVPQSVLVGSLLEHLCSLYESDSDKSKILFESICVQLEKLNVVSSVTYQEEYASIRSQYKTSFYNIIHSVRHKLDPVPLPIPLNSGSLNSNLIALRKQHSSFDKVFNLVSSRYQEEFEEICELGKGAFGKVFKARNKIDRQDYAVKKIDFKDIDLDSDRQQVKKIIREVESLAALQHPHVVRYHHSWMEHSMEEIQEKNDSDGSKSASSFGKKHSISFSKSRDDFCNSSNNFKPSNTTDSTDLSWGEPSLDENKSVNENGKFWIGQRDDDEEDLSASESKNLRTSESKHRQSVKFPNQSSPPSDVILTHGVRRDRMKRVESVVFNTQTGNPSTKFPFLRTSGSDVVRSKSTNSLRDFQILNGVGRNGNNVFVHHPSVHSHSSAITLFIQMQICDSSLQQWLKKRNNTDQTSSNVLSLVDQQKSLDIYKQLLTALSYIHEKEIMHRDLKPRNIFLNGSRPHVLLGDFGLSRPAVSRHSSTVVTPPVVDQFMTFDDLEEHTSGIGTTSYAAPEQLAHENYDFKADMYSAGIILFELTWRLQTDHERYLYIKRLRQADVPVEYTTHWGETAKVLNSLLSFDPNQRPSANELLNKSLFSPSINKDIVSLKTENQKLREEVAHLQLLVNKYQSKFEELGIDIEQ